MSSIICQGYGQHGGLVTQGYGALALIERIEEIIAHAIFVVPIDIREDLVVPTKVDTIFIQLNHFKELVTVMSEIEEIEMLITDERKLEVISEILAEMVIDEEDTKIGVIIDG